jgi:hypothetical protein
MLNVVMLNVIMLNVIILNVIMLNVVMSNVVMLNVIRLNVVMVNARMLSVMAPNNCLVLLWIFVFKFIEQNFAVLTFSLKARLIVSLH